MPLKDVNLYWLRPGELTAYRGHCLLVTDDSGSIHSGVEGLWLYRTRFLSRLTMSVNGKRPNLVSANPVRPHSLLSYHLAPSPAGGDAAPTPEGDEPGGELARIAIELQIADFAGNGLHRDVHLTNHAMAPTTIKLVWNVDADFADYSEAQEGPRKQNAGTERTWQPAPDGGTLLIRYCHPKLPHATELRWAGAPASAIGTTVLFEVELQPRQTRTLTVDIAPIFRGEKHEPVYGTDGTVVRDPAIEQARSGWQEGCARLSTGNDVVQAAWDRAVSDLGSLPLLEGQGFELFAPIAGIPGYVGLFGRDMLMAAFQSALVNPDTQTGSVSLLGHWIAKSYDPHHDAQTGRVLHQRQLSPLALLEKTPFLGYYGDHSASGLFLLALANALAHTGNLEFFRAQRDNALATLEWMDRDADRDGDGFYEYDTESGVLKNQGWKDSDQAILYADGKLVQNPIAVCEVQGLFYAAKRAMALCFAAISEHERCKTLLEQAAELKRRFNQRFWMPDQGTFGLALDPEKQLVTSVADNTGSCLAYGIADNDKAAPAARRLMAPDMFSGWGIRTLSTQHPAFNPFAYHLGTVWPFSNALTALGFARYGCVKELHQLAKAIFDSTTIFHLSRLPEAFGGHARDPRHPHPGIYANACAPQAWSASAITLVIRALLGLTPVAPLRTLILDPHLPEWLPELELSNIRVGETRLSLRFRRDSAGRTQFEPIGPVGDVRLFRIPEEWQGDRLENALSEMLEGSSADGPPRHSRGTAA